MLKYGLRRATDLDPRRLAALAAIGRCGSLAGAAAALHVTPSAISQQLAHLERTTGLALVDRSARGAALTAAGRALAACAEAIARELAAAERDLAALSGRATGRVRVAAFPTVIRFLLVPALERLAAEHPDVTATIEEAEGEPALRRLRHGDLDLVIAERDASLGVEVGRPRRQVTVAPLHTDPYRVTVPAAWPEPAGYADLADRPWIAGTPATAAGQVLERLAREHGFVPRRAHLCVDYPTTLTLVGAGLGAALVPALALRDQNPGVRVSALSGAGARRLDALVTGASPAVDALLAALRAVAPRHVAPRAAAGQASHRSRA